LINDFRKFLGRGNILELAVAVVIGTAFGAVVTSLVKDVLTPLIAAVGGQASFEGLTLFGGNGVVKYGVFLNAFVNFLIVAGVMFVILKTVEKMQSLRKPVEDEPVVVVETAIGGHDQRKRTLLTHPWVG
jgi:large conductance mechanosensitive channel